MQRQKERPFSYILFWPNAVSSSSKPAQLRLHSTTHNPPLPSPGLPHFVFFLGGLSAYICHRIEEKASNKRKNATFAISTGILSGKTVSIPVFRGLLSRFHKPRPSPSARHFVVFSPHPDFSNRQGDIFSSFFVTQSRLFEHTTRQWATGVKRARATACETSDNNKRPFDSTNGIKNVNLRL